MAGAIVVLLAIDTFLTGWMLPRYMQLAKLVGHHSALLDSLGEMSAEHDHTIDEIVKRLDRSDGGAVPDISGGERW